MLRKILTITAFAALAALGSANKTLVINRLLINAPKVAGNGADDPQGVELMEVKNTGSTTVDLTGVAIVIVENESGQKGELDGYYTFPSGTMLAAGKTICVRDGTGSGSTTTYTAGVSLASSLGTSNGTTTGWEFFTSPGSLNSPTTDLSNSGANYILVDGFHESRLSGFTFGSTQLDANNDGVLDFRATGSTTDDLWDTSLDGVLVYDDGGSYAAGGPDDYITQLGMGAEHTIICAQTPSDDWTPDYLMRMYRVNAGVKVYDQFIQADLLYTATGSFHYTLDLGGQIQWSDGTSLVASNFKNAAGVAVSPTTLYATAAEGGNFTSSSSYDHILKGSFSYFY